MHKKRKRTSILRMAKKRKMTMMRKRRAMKIRTPRKTEKWKRMKILS